MSKAALRLTLILLACAAVTPGCNSSAPAKPALPTVTIKGKAWTVELAVTAEQRYEGLSGRAVGSSSGMLFVYPAPKVLEFCMRGCPKAIDIAFIDSNRRIVRIHTMSPEPDLAGEVRYSSDVPAQYAFETAGGALVAAGVKVGDQVTFSEGIPAPAKAESGP